MSERLLEAKKVSEKVSISRSVISELEAKGMFPRRRRITGTTGRVGWVESEIDIWVAN